ncbi:ammonium transporter Rh type A-like [Clavelina lepadiformis]|uniref:ammonium transporter Rh type A-like n=1 Tax=Clavelina lepadiformis TaxID=159417 RepID=UPI004041593F
MSNTRGKETSILLVAQVIFIVLFGLFVDYGERAGSASHGGHNSTSEVAGEELTFDQFYPMYQDVHVMMLIGFGFLMTFLKRHGFGSVGFNFLLTCYVIEWSTLVNGWFGMIGGSTNKIHLDVESLLHADFAAATVLISFGAILGVASPVQLIIMATIEVVVYNVSIYVGVEIFKAVDVGGSIFIHAFGAYFGLAVARMLYKKAQTEHTKEGSIYHSDIFAMIGTIFLWLYWPSFNAGPAVGNERHRAVINTVLSLSACTVVTFAISSVINKKGKLNMVHIQNATLAGGVAMGASADLLTHPFGALLIGSSAAVVSTLGYQYLQPILQKRIKLHDTCGVHNLHGMPGILGAIVSAITISAANMDTYQASFSIFNWTVPQQAGYQIAALAVALGIAVVSGALTGLLLKAPIWDNLTTEELYEDEVFWDCDEEPQLSQSEKLENGTS